MISLFQHACSPKATQIEDQISADGSGGGEPSRQATMLAASGLFVCKQRRNLQVPNEVKTVFLRLPAGL